MDVKEKQGSYLTSFQGFPAVFIVLCAGVFGLLELLPDPFYNTINRINAGAVGAILRLAGVNAVVRDTLVSFDGFTIRVIGECSAVFLSVLPVCFMAAYPSTPAQKAWGLCAGLFVLFFVNLLRIAGIFLAGLHVPAAFEYVHVYLGQVFMIFMAILVCLVWMKWVESGSLDLFAGFFLRFTGAACVLFPAWVFMSEPFIRGNLLIIDLLLGPAGGGVTRSGDIHLYPDTFITFNMVLYGSLVMATKGIPMRGRIRSAFFGLGLLASLHFLFRLFYALLMQSGVSWVMPVMNPLLWLQEWLVPFILWMLMARGELFKKFIYFSSKPY